MDCSPYLVPVHQGSDKQTRKQLLPPGHKTVKWLTTTALSLPQTIQTDSMPIHRALPTETQHTLMLKLLLITISIYLFILLLSTITPVYMYILPLVSIYPATGHYYSCVHVYITVSICIFIMFMVTISSE